MTKLPDSIRVGPIYYQVHEISNLITPDRDTVLNGHILHDACEIRLEASLSPQAKRQVMWHEVVHAIFNQANIGQDETLVEVLAYGIMGVLLDNPWLREE